MVDEQLTTKEVAAALDVDERTVRRYQAAGLLPYKTVKRKNFFPRSAVEALAKVRKQGFKPVDLQAQVAGLEYRMGKLEGIVKFLLHKQDLQVVDTDFQDFELLALYTMSEKVPDKISPQHVNKWIDPILCLREVEYSRISALTNDVHPWRRMFDYAEELMVKVKKKRNYKTSLEWQQAALDISLTQQSIRQCGIMMLETEPNKMPASKRFDILVSQQSDKAIDPMEIVKNMRQSPQASEADQRLLRRLQSGSSASLVGLPGGKP